MPPVPTVPLHPPPEPDLAAMREEIRRTGSLTRGLRRHVHRFLHVTGALSFVGMVGAGILLTGAGLIGMGAPPLLPLSLLLIAVLAVTLCYGAALPQSAWRRRRARSELLRRLELLEPQARARVLIPLRSDADPDTCALARSLLRVLGHPTELTPSAAPVDAPKYNNLLSPIPPRGAGSAEPTSSPGIGSP